MQKEGFAFRLKFQQFVEYYGFLVSCVTLSGTPDNCHKILMSAKLHGYEVGKTKVFLECWHIDQLNKMLASVHDSAVVIQKCELIELITINPLFTCFHSGARFYMSQKVQKATTAKNQQSQ